MCNQCDGDREYKSKQKCLSQSGWCPSRSRRDYDSSEVVMDRAVLTIV